MYKFPIGILVDSLRISDTVEAIKRSAQIGANGIQMYSTEGDNSPGKDLQTLSLTLN